MRKFLVIIVYIIALLYSNSVLSQNSGELLWDNFISGSNSEIINDVKQTADAGYICVGSTTTFGPYPGTESLWLVKTNSVGDTIWTKTFQQTGDHKEYGSSIQITANGDYIISGTTFYQGSFNSDAWLIKCNYAGNVIWETTYDGGTGNEYGESVIIDANGDYVVCGSYVTTGFEFDAMLLKYSPGGNLIWANHYGNGNRDMGMDLRQLANGDYVLVGYSIPTGSINDDLYLVKVYSDGQQYWEMRIGGDLDQRGHAIELYENGDFALAGYDGNDYDNLFDIWHLRTDPSGNILWENTFDNGDQDMAYDITITDNGGMALTGVVNSTAPYYKSLILLKYNELGDIEWVNNYSDQMFNGGTGNCLICNEDNNIVVAGLKKSTSVNNKGWLLGFKGDNQAPEEFSLLEPVDDDTITSISEVINFQWEEAIDPEGDILMYQLHIYNFSDDTVLTTLGTSYLLDGSNFFQNNSVYFWNVTASDGINATQSNTFSFFVSTTTGIQEEYLHDIKIYPNPAHEILIVEIGGESAHKASRIKITDLNGLIHQQIIFNNSIDIASLSAGIYFINILDDKGEVLATNKIIKL